jgi:hypothetical protein
VSKFKRSILITIVIIIAVAGAIPNHLAQIFRVEPIKRAEAILDGGGGGLMQNAQQLAMLMMLFQIIKKTSDLQGKQRDRSISAISNLSKQTGTTTPPQLQQPQPASANSFMRYTTVFSSIFGSVFSALFYRALLGFFVATILMHSMRSTPAHAVDANIMSAFSNEVVKLICSDNGKWLEKCYRIESGTCHSVVQQFVSPCVSSKLSNLNQQLNYEDGLKIAQNMITCFNSGFEQFYGSNRVNTAECKELPAHLRGDS